VGARGGSLFIAGAASLKPLLRSIVTRVTGMASGGRTANDSWRRRRRKKKRDSQRWRQRIALRLSRSQRKHLKQRATHNAFTYRLRWRHSPSTGANVAHALHLLHRWFLPGRPASVSSLAPYYIADLSSEYTSATRSAVNSGVNSAAATRRNAPLPLAISLMLKHAP